MSRVFAFVLLLITMPALAVQPTLMTREDPITGGACEQWSESDHYGGLSPPRAAELGVPWHYARLDSLWVCPSGYASFHADFDELTEAERERIGAFLARGAIAELVTEGVGDSLFGIWLARQIYALRDLDVAEQALVQRALMYQTRLRMGRTLTNLGAISTDLERAEGLDPEAHAAALFHSAVHRCRAGDIEAAVALLASVEDGLLLTLGLDFGEVCPAARVAGESVRE